MTDDPIRRAWKAWREYERRTDVQLSFEEISDCPLTQLSGDARLVETERQEQPKSSNRTTAL